MRRAFLLIMTESTLYEKEKGHLLNILFRPILLSHHNKEGKYFLVERSKKNSLHPGLKQEEW